MVAAYNERERIGQVLGVLARSKHLDEVIVVDDGSGDGTGVAAEAFGVRVIRHERNMGKARAMETGVSASDADIVFFCDADMRGLTEKIIGEILAPVRAGETDMMVGMHDRTIYYLSFILSVIPLLGGLRAVRRSLWDAIPSRYKTGFMIEAALNFYARYWGSGYQYKVYGELSQTIKERKYGFLPGIFARAKMEAQVFASYFRLHMRDIPPTVKSGRIAAASAAGAGLGAILGLIILFASYSGPAVFLREVFAEELQTDDAPIVHMLLYIAANASVELIATIGIFIAAVNIVIILINIKDIRYLWLHRPAGRERVGE